MVGYKNNEPRSPQASLAAGHPAAVVAGAIDNGRERKRDTDITYVIQSDPLKNVSLRGRNVMFRSLDENRLIIGYTLALC
ncbi:OprD family outer membrane porin [Pseudomonas sp. 2835]|uniref:OprD family outer membrane porin n=1 Tax=Pseudomonas sp. 2835 TaxID=3156451 RepID=UPI003D2504CF